MSRFVPIRRVLAAVPIALATLGACSDASAPTAGRIAFSFAARGDANTQASGATASSGGTVVVGVGGTDTLRLTSVRLVIDELELVQSGAAGACTDDSHRGEPVPGCVEIESGPYLVDLPVNGARASALTMSLPAGSYGKIEMKLRQADSGDDRAFIAANADMAGVSVLASGTYRGKSFVWRNDVEAALELYLSPALVADGARNVTVNIDVGRWFRRGSGGIIDPATAGPGQPDHAAVAANIAASFGAFNDDDRDGRDDHGGRRNDD